MFKKIVKFFWSWAATHACENLSIWGNIKTLNEYGKVLSITTFESDEGIIVPDSDFFALKDKTGTVHDIYFNNLHFHTVDNPTNTIFQVFLKSTQDKWVINKKGNSFDASNPETKCVEIYYWFDIETMHGFRCSNQEYTSGTWDEYVNKTINEFDRIVDSITVESQISDAYKNLKVE